MNKFLGAVGLFGLLAATGCELDAQGVEGETLDLVVAGEDGRESTIGHYRDGELELDGALLAAMIEPEVEGAEEEASWPVDLFVAVGGTELSIDPANPVVRPAEPLVAGDAVALRVVRDAEEVAWLDLTLTQARDDIAYAGSCYPGGYWSITSGGTCGYCGSGKRRWHTAYGQYFVCTDGSRGSWVYGSWDVCDYC